MPYSEETAGYRVIVFDWLIETDAHSVLATITVQSHHVADQRSQSFDTFLHRCEFYRLLTVPHLISSSSPSVSYNQIIGMDLIESEQIVTCVLQLAHMNA